MRLKRRSALRAIVDVLGQGHRMIDCGTTTFTEPEEFRGRLPRASINCVVTGPGDFKARLTWVNLRRVSLVRVEEKLPRIAFLALAPGSIFVTFPIRSRMPMIWGGVKIGPREMVLHRLGDRIHQSSTGPCQWGLISVTPNHLATYSRALTHTEVNPPRNAIFLKPPLPIGAKLLRLHAEACRLAESKQDLIAHSEVSRAFEQDLIHALVDCLTASTSLRNGVASHRHAQIMARFEDALAMQGNQHWSIPETCAAVGVQERTLRICCAKFLGLSPLTYDRLHRLNLVRAALLRADPNTATIGEVATKYGFSELGRFAVAYRSLFGETPSTTLRGRSPIRDVADVKFA